MSLQMAELHYLSEPSCDAAAIAERANVLIRSDIGVSEDPEPDGTVIFHHTRHIRQYTDGAVSAQTAFLGPGERQDPDRYTNIVHQSWSLDDAAERINKCTHTRVVTEMMASPFDPDIRVDLFHGVLQAIVEQTNPHVIVFHHSEQAIAPGDYLQSCEYPSIERLGAVNTRFYIVDKQGPDAESDDMIMDTRGLEEIGLHDIQCHFRDLDPNEVSRVLYSTAMYVFENGPVIESGQTITGADPGSMWQCQFEESLLEPRRTVLDLHAGALHAAGER